MKIRLNVAALLLVVSAATWAQAPGNIAPSLALPAAPVEDVPVTLHGTRVADPYRWLEDTGSRRVMAWMEAQASATRGVLDRIDQREQIAARVAELSRAAGVQLRGLVRLPAAGGGERLYYLKRAPGERQFRLFVREGLAGPERLLVDPEREADRLGRPGVPHAIDYFEPAWDGRHLAYGLSAAGSEDATLHVIDADSGRALLPPLPRATNDKLNWAADSRSIFVNQLKAPTPGEPASERYLDSRVLWLKLDAPAGSEPQPLFGPTVTRGLGLQRLDVAELISVPGSRWVVARTTDTTLPEGHLFVAPLDRIGQPGTPWRRIGAPADRVRSIQLAGDTLYVLTRLAAPRGEVVALDLAHDTLARTRVVAAEPGSGVLEWFRVVEGGVVTGHRQGTAVGLRLHRHGDPEGRPLERARSDRAGHGAAHWPVAQPLPIGATLLHSRSGWLEPTTLRLLEGEASRDSGLLPAPAALPGSVPVVVREVEVASHDGVKVPLTLLHREGLARDGTNPVLLNGYAAYGFSITASFNAQRMAWLERGGVLAFVNARGSGVHGDAWYRAGQKLTKRNTWLDGIAAARWLIREGYGSPATMTAMGTSAGGIFVGRMTTAAPELFAGAVFDVGVLDAVRAELTANGITNISEFGTVADPAGFKALLEMSTYHQIRDGVRYPGVLLVHGLNDPRVDVWHSAKTAARLQAANPGGRPALLRLDALAGHGGGSTAPQRESLQADIYAFLLWQAGKLRLKD